MGVSERTLTEEQCDRRVASHLGAQREELERERDAWHRIAQEHERKAERLRRQLQRAGVARDYLDREINRMRRVLQDMGEWDRFCKEYGKRYLHDSGGSDGRQDP